MTEETALALAAKPRSHSLGSQVAYALQYPSFVALEGEEVFAGAGVYPDLNGEWRAWAVIPAMGVRRLRWVYRQIQAFLSAFNKPVRAAVELNDGAGYVFVTSLGFTSTLRVEHNAGRYFVLLERGI